MRARHLTHRDRWDWPDLHATALREARRVLDRREDAEDAAQEAVIRAYRSRSRCLTPEAPHAWVRTIARREAFRVHARGGAATSEFTEAEDVGIPDISEDVLDRLGAGQVLAALQRNDQQLLIRRYVLEQTSSEIARELDMPAATVRVHLHRLTKRVRAANPAVVT